ncbi:GDSL-type esterase/lipase family protein [Pseudopedobacter beijingensis]|uniref:GDSL-type esterase/lipase family protein n=1 Tax=Pseudopedobacter beijingensis TaxID=1207056 RepID=A0ABW4I6E5_9SPHI
MLKTKGQTSEAFSYYSEKTLSAIEASAEQRAQILAIREFTNEQVKLIKANEKLTEQQKKDSYKEVYSKSSKDYYSVISDKQKAIIKQLLKDIQDQKQRDGVIPVTDSSSYYNQYYQQRMSLFNSFPLVKNTVMFLGSSSAERGAWSELFPNSIISNRGIGGDNTLGVLARLDQAIAMQPSKVFLFIGTNDLGSRAWPVNFVYDKYVQIVDRLKEGSPKTKIYIVSLPINEQVVTIERFKGKSVYFKQFNEKLGALAKEKNLVFVNFFNQVLGKNGELISDYTTDGIHLTPQGYKLMAEYFRKHKFL